MPLYDYICKNCKEQFEAFQSYEKRGEAYCPKCSSPSIKTASTLFRVAGRGDLRESTTHGCHGCFSGVPHKH